MATIYNSDLTKGIQENAKIQINRDAVPNQLADKVVPVMETNPKLLRRCNIVRSTTRTATGSVTFYTTPTDKDFYLVAAQFTLVADAVADNTNAFLAVQIDGATSSRSILQFQKLSLTAFNATESISFPIPIKLDRNSNISISTTFTVGASVMSAAIIGFTVED